MDVAQYEMEGITEFQRKQKTEVLLLGVKGLHTKIMSGREKSPPQSLLSFLGWANKIDTDR